METVRFKPLFLIYVFLCIYFGWYNNIFFYIIAVVLHEYGHCVVARYLGYNTSGIVFDLYGAGLRSDSYFDRKHDIIISLAGPFVNILIILIVMACWWVFPSCYIITKDLVICNVVVMIFNLLPIYPLDFGRVLVAVLGKKIKRQKLLKFSGVLCLLFGIFIFMLFVFSCISYINFNMLFISLFLISNGVLCLKNLKYDFLKLISSKKTQNTEIKLWKVDSFENIKLLRLVSREYYSVFILNSEGKKKVKFEEEIFN